MPLSKSRLPWF